MPNSAVKPLKKKCTLWKVEIHDMITVIRIFILDSFNFACARMFLCVLEDGKRDYWKLCRYSAVFVTVETTETLWHLWLCQDNNVLTLLQNHADEVLRDSTWCKIGEQLQLWVVYVWLCHASRHGFQVNVLWFAESQTPEICSILMHLITQIGHHCIDLQCKVHILSI